MKKFIYACFIGTVITIILFAILLKDTIETEHRITQTEIIERMEQRHADRDSQFVIMHEEVRKNNSILKENNEVLYQIYDQVKFKN